MKIMIIFSTLMLSLVSGLVSPLTLPSLQRLVGVVWSVAALTAISFALAFITESTVEYMFGKPFDHIPKIAPYKWTLMYISLAVGVFLSFYYQLDMIVAIAELAGGSLPASWVGFLLTGFAIGRGSNYLHDFVTAHITKPAARA